MRHRARSVWLLLATTAGCAEIVTPSSLVSSDSAVAASADVSTTLVHPTAVATDSGAVAFDASWAGEMDAGAPADPPPFDPLPPPDAGPAVDTGYAGNDVPHCPQPPDIDLCTSDEECGAVGGGCFCGPQPSDGVRRDHLIGLAQCRQIEWSQCTLTCARDLETFLAQDGRTGTLLPQMRCVPVDGVRRCRTLYP